ncbi:MAG: 5'-nucleotidase, lipoprotein e(P4) family [Pyrinomonadaceae bacterium]|nr:5'-nucleotidase, lipoprotein e(P4) family [Pyrinomonadaceae bacterium]
MALFLSAYAGATFFGQSAAQQAQTAPIADNEYQVGATLWTQTSAEFRALAYQSFNYARLLFDRDLKTNRSKKMKRAVVVDVDETVMDNSPFQVSAILKSKGFTGADFTEWCERRTAAAVPGALEFLKYAHAKGARVFYVTNRNSAERQCTADNLKQLGFPDVSDETLLLRETTSSKEPRRQMIAQKHRIVLLIGDNLNDLAQVFEKKSIADRSAAVDQMKDEFGSRFIVIPNTMYGEWEGAVYEYKNLTEAEKAAKRRSTLKGF